MKRSVLLHPFFSITNLCPVLVQFREAAASITPEPPKTGEEPDEPDEPEREYPFWTCFTDNPRPRNSK
jgi:hypothetical protein